MVECRVPGMPGPSYIINEKSFNHRWYQNPPTGPACEAPTFDPKKALIQQHWVQNLPLTCILRLFVGLLFKFYPGYQFFKTGFFSGTQDAGTIDFSGDGEQQHDGTDVNNEGEYELPERNVCYGHSGRHDNQ